MSRLSGVALLTVEEEASTVPTEYAQAKNLRNALKNETVKGLYFCQRKACLVLVTTSGRKIGIPKLSFRYPVAEVEEAP